MTHPFRLARPTLTVLAATGLLLAACDRTPATSEDAPAKAAASAESGTFSREVEAQAFEAAWGSKTPAMVKATVETGDEGFTYREGSLIHLGEDRFALVSKGHGGEAHVSSGALAIHYLIRTADGFQRAGAWPNFVMGGSFGNPPDWTLRTDLTPNPALTATGGGTWQGYSCAFTDLVELTPEKPVLRAEGVSTYYDSTGALEDAGDTVEGELAPGEKGRSFRVRYTGSKSAEVIYQRSGETYAATSQPDLPQC